VKFLGAGIIVTLILASASRGIFLTMLLIMVLYFSCYSKKRLIFSLISISLIGIVLVVSFKYLSYIHIDNVNRVLNIQGMIDKYNGPANPKDSIWTRKQLMQNGMNAFIDSRGVGVGAGGSNVIQEKAGLHITSMHNFWLELLVEGGSLFFIVFSCWYMKIVVSLYRSYTTINGDIRYYASACALAMSGFLLGAISSSSVIYFFPMWILYGFAITTINNAKRLKDAEGHA
jgi:teichuronic acid biosynthesis protein TuaE